MAEYTIELKDVVAAGHNIFDFRYPFYDESKRAAFEETFIRHFFFREIGVPTVDRFKVNLADKMNVVFPYYNELFKAATIEYSVLDNYKLTEEFTHTRENEGKTSGVSSTVGQLFGNQETESKQNRVVDSQGNVDTIGRDTENETSVTDTNATGNSVTNANGTTKTDTESETTVDGTVSKETSESGTNKQTSVRKHLDTPQGLTDLTESKYLTTLDQDDVDATNSKNGTENTTDTQTTNATGLSETTNTNNSETDTTDNSKSETERNLERNTLVNQENTNKETTDDTVSGTVKDEQKTTQDNNTRTYIDSKQTEKHTLVRHGNIGVDTDSDMIEKHVRLQKTLKSIERMFFDECEDLFMLVY